MYTIVCFSSNFRHIPYIHCILFVPRLVDCCVCVCSIYLKIIMKGILPETSIRRQAFFRWRIIHWKKMAFDCGSCCEKNKYAYQYSSTGISDNIWWGFQYVLNIKVNTELWKALTGCNEKYHWALSVPICWEICNTFLIGKYFWTHSGFYFRN